jgi:membrane protein YdbS with pleckstrin-like domain
MILVKEEPPVVKAKIHWKVYIVPVLVAILFSIIFLSQLVVKSSGNLIRYSMMAMTLICGYGPFLLAILDVKSRSYTIQGEKLLVQEGYFVSSKKEVEIRDINNIEVIQTPLEKFLNAGKIIIYAGNDQSIVLRDITSPNDFKKNLS